MRILSSEVKMNSTQDLFQQDSLEETLQFWDNGPGSSASNSSEQTALKDSVDISTAARKAQSCDNQSQDDEDGLNLSPTDKAKLKLIKTLLEALTGKEIRMSFVKIKSHREENQKLLSIRLANQTTTSPRLNWGLRYDRVEIHQEKETSTFNAGVNIKTADGQEINASLAVSMSREFVSQNEVHLRAGNAAIDPLVINFDAPAAALSDRNFRFDLDSDGQEEQISFLKPGSGFLALDVNGDGQINNGKELFGPQSGNGFSELARYDEDHNGWIDEGDSVYQNLRIWSMDENGNQQLVALGQKGIGALYVGNISTPFSVRDSQNNALGEVRSSGLFMRENGSLGSIQQVDLVV